MAFFSWLVGDLRAHRSFLLASTPAGIAVGTLISMVTPWWVGAIGLGLVVIGLLWLLRLLVAYGWVPPWRD